ncbi:transcriptional regulator [Actinomadura sp. GC306]|uniref:winged helix-turn-helix transcriptional regulator n=1 Tax=Actinomadura sp. GC306 TaxID=2530367 RepID=UPI001047069E|nr:helix-turn-helix domain-containing protein [Actinomadura sp. GC306]TDC63957.1 transcriptional regulator [Actinomadura sp. GC306]
MAAVNRSECPVNLAVEVLGDRWSLLVLRDIMFAGKRHYRELLASDEGISTKVLAERLRSLTDTGLLTRSEDSTHKQKAIYSLTERSIALVPVLVQLGVWGHRELGADDRLSRYAETLDQGGRPLQEAFMDDLREAHLGARARHRARGERPTLQPAD